MNKIFQHNVKVTPWPIADKSVDCVVTSPPYWMLRNYNHPDQIGMEATPELFIQSLVNVFSEACRVLKDEGTLWVNIGDTYCSTAPNTMGDKLRQDGILSGVSDLTAEARRKQRPSTPKGMKPKDLVGIPWMLAFALRSAGWYLRQDIIWSKPNPMPESVTDRCTKSHEYIFMLSKSQKYYYDADSIRTGLKESSLSRLSQDVDSQVGSNRVPGKTNGTMKAVVRSDKQRGHSRRHAGFNDRWDKMSVEEQQSNGANKRSVWHVATKPFSEAHFATFPEELIIDCIKAGCPPGGIVLDPFMGAGTTALVAKSQGRNYIGLELNPEYIKIAEKRLRSKLGVFA